MSVIEVDLSPNDNAIRVLEDALEAAKRGEIQVVAIASLDRNSVYSSAWSKTSHSKPAMIGAIENLKFDYIFTETDIDLSRNLEL